MPQLFGCRASVIPGLFVRPVLRPGPFPSFFGSACSIPRASGVACSGENPLHPHLGGDLQVSTRLDCTRTAPARRGAACPLSRLIWPRSGTRQTVGTMEKGAEYQPHQRGPWRMICNRGPLPLIRLCACSVGAGATCPAVQQTFQS